MLPQMKPAGPEAGFSCLRLNCLDCCKKLSQLSEANGVFLPLHGDVLWYGLGVLLREAAVCPQLGLVCTLRIEAVKSAAAWAFFLSRTGRPDIVMLDVLDVR